jgi:hypothetical protein
MKSGSRLGRFLLLAVVLGVLASFYPRTPDVRLTLCQNLVQELSQVGSEHVSKAIQWQSHQFIDRGYLDYEVQIQFNLMDSEGLGVQAQASCFYPYEQDDIGAETFQQPSSAYSSYPAKMIIRGQTVDKEHLTQAINKIIKARGKVFLEKITPDSP